jgi:glucokinase
MRVLAVDLGGTHVSCGAVHNGELLEVRGVETDSRGCLANLLPTLSEALRQLRSRQANSFEGIGFGFCGLVDSAAGRVVSTYYKYSDATDIGRARNLVYR